MGKKNKKSRRYADEDDILLGPPPTDHDDAPGRESGADEVTSADVDVDVAEDDAPAPSEVAEDAPSSKKSKSDGKKRGQSERTKKAVVNIDLIRLEDTMMDILRNYRDKPEDWLVRTIEKNMHLPKHSLRDTLEPHILEEIMERVEDKLDREYDEEMERRKRWEALVAEMKEKAVLSTEDKERLVAGARKVGLDPDDAVAAVMEAIEARTAEDAQLQDNEETTGEGEGDADEQLDVSNASLGLSIILALQPYLLQPSPGSSSLGKLASVIRLFICSFLYNAFRFILGENARVRADRVWEKQYLPAIDAQELAQEKEKDQKMLLDNKHLWSNEQGCWIEKGAAFQPPTDNKSPGKAPPTIRWNGAKQQWERWSKNLTTRTKAMKQAAASGRSTSFTRGTFVPVRAGEGWATAPDQPETENKQIVAGGIRFFACLPMKSENHLAVVDVTTWATKTLLSKDAARELEAVDSGRALFSLDASTVLAEKKGGKKGKGSKGSKTKKQISTEDAREDGEGGHSVERKGIGCTAQINQKYLDQL